jgi:acetyl-CoA C-acetyltransferase
MDPFEGAARRLGALEMRKVAIVGVGHSRFGRRTDVNVAELAFESIKDAIVDSGIDKKDVSSVTVGTAGGWYEEALPAVTVNEYAGFHSVSTMRVEAACASGSAAVRGAYLDIASGQADVALAIGIEKMTEVDTLTSVELIGRAGSYMWEFENYGMTFPAYYALYAVAHMKKFGTTEEDLARVAVKAHHYGAMNNLAQFQKEITIEKVLSSQVVSWPLKLYDACPLTDGSAAVVLAEEETAKRLTDTPIWIKGFGISSDSANLSKRDDFVGLSATVDAAKRAYAASKLGPSDIDVATCHDCFTIAEIMAYEDLGFCKKGEGQLLVRDGQTEIGGRIPVNLDGGLKAKGHPIGATGVSMMVEITKQLRGEAGQRQAPIKNGNGLVHNVGGTGHYCYVTVLSRSN